MVNYDAILNIVSIVLILIILFIILFGCRFKHNRYERFTNPEEEKEKKDSIPGLSEFENQILDKLSSGQLSTDGLTELITSQKFTQENLENMINYVEHFKGNIEK
jgi:cell division protein FtsW (lipid II flippase)